MNLNHKSMHSGVNINFLRVLVPAVILLASCSSRKYFSSVSNPYSIGVSILVKNPAYYLNLKQEDNFAEVYISNHSKTELKIPGNFSQVLRITAFSRFSHHQHYANPDISYYPENNKKTLLPGDSVVALRIPLDLLMQEPNGIGWYKDEVFTKKAISPAFATYKKNQPYCRLRAEFKAGDRWIISKELRINVGHFSYPEKKYKNLTLRIFLHEENFPERLTTHTGILECQVENHTGNNIPLFNDPGSVRFMLYGYSENRTSVMQLSFKVNGNELIQKPLTVHDGSTVTVFSAPVKQILYNNPDGLDWFWSWNKKNPPVSPAVYNNGKWVNEVELWFGIIANGKEYQSNSLTIPIRYAGI